MIKKRILRGALLALGAAAALGVTSCGEMGWRDHGHGGGPGPMGGGGHKGPPRHCGTECTVEIKVENGTCKPIPMDIDVEAAPGAVIHWRLTGDPGWTFKSNGIEFKTAGWPSTFEHPSAGGATHFEWTVKHVTPAHKDYHYWIHVEKAGQPCDHDPAIWV